MISCDTAVAHLAGAMGKPVWVMLKKNPDWRWSNDSDRTAWYPDTRLYRQTSIGDWPQMIARLGHNLNQKAQLRRLSSKV